MMDIKIQDKLILDPCCGSKMFWFDKSNPAVLYADVREETCILCDGRVFQVKPDTLVDFRNMPYPNNHFKLIVFDPPHLTSLGENSWMAKKYGVLKSSWKDDIRDGFNECWRCLDVYGTMIFKWNESDVKVSDVLKIIPQMPLFGHTTGRQSKTIWMTFFKET
jgi:hypothetical protein